MSGNVAATAAEVRVMGMHEELIELETGFWGAAGDGDFYREHFADDGACIFGFGRLDKEQTVEAVSAAQPWSSFGFEQVAVTSLADDVAAVTYAAAARRGQQRYDAMVSSLYVRRGGRWQLGLHQQTPVGSS